MYALIAKEILFELHETFKKPLILMGGLVVILILLSPLFIYIFFAKDLASKESIINSNNRGVILLDRNEVPYFNFYEAKQKKVVSLSEIPDVMEKAVIATEDKDFYKHKGFSIRAIFRAMFDNILGRDFKYGASTITQQLVKNTLLTPKKSVFRKYQEIVLAFEIERLYNKQEILEMYLNSIYFGEGATGVGTGAMAYFGKDVSQLTLAQASLLAAILPAPSRLSPINGDKETAFRLQENVLKKMQNQGFISKEELNLALKEKIVFSPQKEIINAKAPHFALMVKEEFLSKYSQDELETSGFKVKTTLDLSFQDFAEQTVATQVQRLSPNRVTNGALIALDAKTSEILALVGSKDWFNEKYGKVNVVISDRQVGSAFKPVIYAKAFEDRIITPATILKDEPRTFQGNYKPKNYDGKFRGDMLPRRALANSINIPAIEVMEKVGVINALNFAKTLGINSFTDPSNYGLSLILGAGEVKLLELTNAYAVFANGGLLNKPTTILEIRNKIEEPIYTYNPSSQKVLSEEVAFIISSILSDDKTRREVFGNSLTISHPAAVKTGTTEDYKDSLTIGYTPSFVVGVWVGNNDATPMDRVAGSLGAAPIWRQVMTKFLVNKPIEKFIPPFGIEEVSICKNNGLLAKVATGSAYIEYFIQGTAPSKTCTEIEPTITPEANHPTPQISETPTSPPSETSTPSQTPTSIPSNGDEATAEESSTIIITLPVP